MQDDWHGRDTQSDGPSRQRAARSDGDAEGPSLLSIALAHKGKLVLVGIVATLLAYVVLSRVEPTYEASAQVLLEVQSDPVIDIPNAVPEAPDDIATLESAIVLMRSPDILRAVVEELDLVAQAEFNSSLRPPGAIDKLRSAVSALVDDISGAEPEPSTGAPRDPVERTARSLRGHVTVRSIGESRVMEITTSSASAALAAHISNTIARQYIAQQTEVKTAAGVEATEWLEQRTADARARLEEAQSKLTSFAQDMATSDSDVSSDLDAQIADLTLRMIELDTQHADLSAQRAEIAELRATDNYLTLASTVELPTLTGLVEQLADLDGTIVELQAVYGDHPRTREAQATRRQLISLLETESARLLEGLDVRIAVLEERRRDLEREIREIRTAKVGSQQSDFRLDTLTLELETSRDVYQRFLLRQKEMQQRSQFQSPGVRLVAEAERPSDPVAPQKAKLSVLAGIAAGAVTLLLLALRDARTPEEPLETEQPALDLVELNRMGTLLTLPFVKGIRRPADFLRYLHEKPDSDLAVSLVWLKSVLKPRSNDWSSLIIVTSAGRGEGKSTLAMLLAESFSRDHSTVLINADGDGWLTEFARTDAFQAAGFTFLNYSDEILRLVNEEFAVEDRLVDRSDTPLGADIVILDASSMPLSSGMLEIAQQADHTVFAAAWNHTRTDRIKRCVRALDEMGIAISALALTMMPRGRQGAFLQLPTVASPLQLTKRSKT